MCLCVPCRKKLGFLFIMGLKQSIWTRMKLARVVDAAVVCSDETCTLSNLRGSTASARGRRCEHASARPNRTATEITTIAAEKKNTNTHTHNEWRKHLKGIHSWRASLFGVPPALVPLSPLHLICNYAVPRALGPGSLGDSLSLSVKRPISVNFSPMNIKNGRHVHRKWHTDECIRHTHAPSQSL